MTTISVGTHIVEARWETIPWTQLLITQGIVEVLPNDPFYVLVMSLTKKGVTIPKHSKLANLTVRPTVVVNMLDGIDTDPENKHSIRIRQRQPGVQEKCDQGRPCRTT